MIKLSTLIDTQHVLLDRTTSFLSLERSSLPGRGGYRGRTDDLLRARQAL